MRDFIWCRHKTQRAKNISDQFPPGTIIKSITSQLKSLFGDADIAVEALLQGHRHNHLLVKLRLGARRAPVGAPFGFEVSDALASFRGLA